MGEEMRRDMDRGNVILEGSSDDGNAAAGLIVAVAMTAGAVGIGFGIRWVLKYAGIDPGELLVAVSMLGLALVLLRVWLGFRWRQQEQRDHQDMIVLARLHDVAVDGD
jgi:nicotinamide riboside transporter PnuC